MLGVALLGCGGMGMGLAQGVNAGARGRVVVAVDVDRERAEKAARDLGAEAATDVAVALSRRDVDAVLVASPPFLHLPLVESAASAGKHVFCEKPLGATVAECDAILAATERAGVTLMVGQVLRWYPCWRKIIEMVDEGAIGRVIGVQVTRIGGAFGQGHPGWRRSLAQSGGALMEINAHEIDFMARLCGEPARVYAEADRYVIPDIDYPDLAFVSVRFAGGAVGLLHSSICSAVGRLNGVVHGTEGSIAYSDGFSSDGEICWARNGEKQQTIRVGDLKYPAPVATEVDEFLAAVEERRAPAVPGRDGRRAVLIAEAAYRSAERGEPVVVG
jgi:predicted dehydrogenase